MTATVALLPSAPTTQNVVLSSDNSIDYPTSPLYVGQIGLGTTVPDAPFQHWQYETRYTNARPVQMHLQYDNEPVVAPTIAIDYHGIDLVGYSNSANVTANVNLYPFESNAQYGGTGHLGGLYAGYLFTNNLGGGTVDTSVNLRLMVQQKAASKITNAYGVRYDIPVIGDGTAPTITNLYAFYVDDIASSTQITTNKYAFYSVSGKHRFGGQVDLVGGVITLTGSPSGLGGGTRYIGSAGSTDSWYVNAATGGNVYLAVGETLMFRATGTQLGFFGAGPGSRVTITGSRSGATVSVLTQILSALNGMGLIIDSTTA